MERSSTSSKRRYSKAAEAIIGLLHVLREQPHTTFVTVERRSLELLLACWQDREDRTASRVV